MRVVFNYTSSISNDLQMSNSSTSLCTIPKARASCNAGITLIAQKKRGEKIK